MKYPLHFTHILYLFWQITLSDKVSSCTHMTRLLNNCLSLHDSSRKEDVSADLFTHTFSVSHVPCLILDYSLEFSAPYRAVTKLNNMIFHLVCGLPATFLSFVLHLAN